jgi:hypothetical protein
MTMVINFGTDQAIYTLSVSKYLWEYNSGINPFSTIVGVIVTSSGKATKA